MKHLDHLIWVPRRGDRVLIGKDRTGDRPRYGRVVRVVTADVIIVRPSRQKWELECYRGEVEPVGYVMGRRPL